MKKEMERILELARESVPECPYLVDLTRDFDKLQWNSYGGLRDQDVNLALVLVDRAIDLMAMFGK